MTPEEGNLTPEIARWAEQVHEDDPTQEQPNGWQPIETAPKDGTEIDLWVVDFDLGPGGTLTRSREYRVPAATWSEPTESTTDLEEQWVRWDSPYWFRIELGNTRVTHWMPPPNPPIGTIEPNEEKADAS